MSDQPAKTPEGVEAPAAPEAARAEHVERAPSRSEPSKDYDPHFQEVVKHLMDMPEKLVNALREAIPPKVEEEPETAVHGEAKAEEEDETPIPPGGKHHVSAKRGFAQKWLGR